MTSSIARIAASAAFALVTSASLTEARADAPHCEAMLVDVDLPGVPGAQIYGELCVPSGPRPQTVQLLVHSTWYNLRSWDPPEIPLSYVRAAVAARYATFNVDRFGTGRSTKPASNLVTIARVEDSLHQVIQKLRSGAIGGHAYSKVVWVGASFGSGYGWVNAALHGTAQPGGPDADAFVYTGLLHITKLSFLGIVLGITAFACEEPALKQLGLDCGYITNQRGHKGDIYYHMPAAWPGLVPDGVDDAILRDVVSAFLLGESVDVLGGVVGFPGPSPQFVEMPTTGPTAYSNQLSVPALLVVGDKDRIFCNLPGDPDGIDCSSPASIMAWEGRYYPAGNQPDLILLPDTGHEIALHLSAPGAYVQMLAWIDAHVGGHAPR